MSDVPALRVSNLAVTFPTDGGVLRAVENATLEVPRGGAVALVGESGCGKSAMAHALLRILPEGAAIPAGRVELEGRDLLALSDEEMQKLRGDRLAIVFQEPMGALNPVYTVGAQIAEAVRLHRKVSRREAKQRAIEALRAVGMPAPEDREADYPYQLSGGMRQRVLLAMAMINDPVLLVADEPTTSLDATVEAQILERIATLRAEREMALLLVSHDLELVAAVVDTIVVMYAGRTVETGPRDRILDEPAHPYTRALLGCGIPKKLPALISRKQRRDPLPTIDGRSPDRRSEIAGCVFAGRCPEEVRGCTEERPPEVPVPGGGTVACWRR